MDAAQGGLEIVHRTTYNTPGVPENPEDALPGVPMLPPAPETMLQSPVPTAGAFAAKVVEVAQSTWSGPALAVVGAPTKVTSTSSVDEAQGGLATVQRKV